jgi:uncharacterized protein (DUF924 family)
MDDAAQIREFWFGKLPLSAKDFAERGRLWFGDPADTDEERRERDNAIQARFGATLDRAARGELDSWAASPRRRLSLIVLLDQIPRNIYRGTSRAFTHDAKALDLAVTGIQSGADAALDVVERMFFYMPLQHAESLDMQDESVAASRRLVLEAPDELKPGLADAAKYAEAHRDIIKRFGRFPYRNRVLGRVSTPEEREFIAHHDGFGQ